MTLCEDAAFRAEIAHVAKMARIAAVTIETRDDAQHVRQQAAAGALYALAEGVRAAFPQQRPVDDTGSGGFAASP